MFTKSRRAYASEVSSALLILGVLIIVGLAVYYGVLMMKRKRTPPPPPPPVEAQGVLERPVSTNMPVGAANGSPAATQ